MKARIYCNVWGNWYGYLGARRGAAFGNDAEFTAEQYARQWLQEQKRAGHRVDEDAAPCDCMDCSINGC